VEWKVGWYALRVNRRSLLLLSCLVPLPVVGVFYGCHSHTFSEDAEQARAERHVEQDTARQQLEMIPPPSKNRFMAVHTAESWENPSITVEPGMLELRVTLADPNPSLGSGGMLRPVAARQQELNISLDKLDEAVSAIPESAWPYGRVISVEEPNNTPKSAEPQVRRNLEVTVRELNDLGIVAYDVHDGNVR
jgi:hypothetical protein